MDEKFRIFSTFASPYLNNYFGGIIEAKGSSKFFHAFVSPMFFCCFS
jgi:hypothetical protein